MLDQTVLSERRACRLAGLSRDAFRHPPEPTPATQALSARIIELAQVRRRFGYRRLHDLLRPKFPDVNHKKVYRLYSEASLAVRRNGYIESFNGKFRDECLNEHWFTSLAQARQVDLSMELVANQAVSPGWMVSGSDQFRRTVAGGL